MVAPILFFSASLLLLSLSNNSKAEQIQLGNLQLENIFAPFKERAAGDSPGIDHNIDLKSIFGNLPTASHDSKNDPFMYEALKPAFLPLGLNPANLDTNVHTLESANSEAGCIEGFIPNAAFFQEHPDPTRPCYTHICYPKEAAPFYFWEERFQADKCCKYRGNEIVYGTEIILETDDKCSEDVVRCEVPLNDPDAPLIPVHEVGKLTCCKYNGLSIHPGDPIEDYDSCGQISCVFTESGVELRHEVIHEEGCCDIFGKMVGEGQIYNDVANNQSYLCYKGNPYKVIVGKLSSTASTKNQVTGNFGQNHGAPNLSQVKGPTVTKDFSQNVLEEDINSFSRPIEALPETDGKDACTSCYASNLEQGYFGQIINTLQSFITEKAIKKVSFLVNGNNKEQKLAASIIAAKTDLISPDRLAYLTYYAYHSNGHACAIYKWDDQCSTNKCGFAQKFLASDPVEEHQKISNGSASSFENGADLAFVSSTAIGHNRDLPFCPSASTSISHEESLILLFATYNDKHMSFPKSLLEHKASGCNIAIVTMDWSHFFEAEKLASQNSQGKPLAFRIEPHGLGQFAKCQLECTCSESALDLMEHRSVQPAFINNCAVTLFKRNSTASPVEEMDKRCSDFDLGAEKPVQSNSATAVDTSLLQSHAINSPEMADLLGQFNIIMDNGQRHGYHEDMDSMDNCLRKYGTSWQSMLYCIHVLTTQQQQHRKKRDLSALEDTTEHYDNDNVDDILDIDFSMLKHDDQHEKSSIDVDPYFVIDG